VGVATLYLFRIEHRKICILRDHIVVRQQKAIAFASRISMPSEDGSD
jgi:hypothetical protein